MELPVYELTRTMTPDEATELVGAAVPDSEPTIRRQGLWVDPQTGEPVLAYMPMGADETELLRSSVTKIKYGETLRAKTGFTNISRTFGMSPRKAYQKRESCRPTSMSYEQPDEHAVLVLMAERFADVMQEILPEQYRRDVDALREVDNSWRMSDEALWTSGVVNRSSSLPYHRDGFNFHTWSAMPVVRRFMYGGHLHFPEFGETVECRDGWTVYFPGYKYVHGVTPMKQTRDDGYRYSVVYYALRGMKDCFTYAMETAEGRKRRTAREENLAAAVKGDAPFRAAPKPKKVRS